MMQTYSHMLDDFPRNMTIVNNIEYLFVDLSIHTDTLSLVCWGYVVAGSAAAHKAAHCVGALLCTPIRLLCTFVHVCNVHLYMSLSQANHIARINQYCCKLKTYSRVRLTK